MVRIGRSGFAPLGIGRAGIENNFKSQVDRKNLGNAEFKYYFDWDNGTNLVPVIITITITGKAVFKDFKKEDFIMAATKIVDIKFELNPDSDCTILSDLSVPEIYLRIKNFYDEVLNIDGNKIANLPQKPTDAQMLDLVDQINIRGFLVYARSEKDKYEVRLEQYANALKEKL